MAPEYLDPSTDLGGDSPVRGISLPAMYGDYTNPYLELVEQVEQGALVVGETKSDLDAQIDSLSSLSDTADDMVIGLATGDRSNPDDQPEFYYANNATGGQFVSLGGFGTSGNFVPLSGNDPSQPDKTPMTGPLFMGSNTSANHDIQYAGEVDAQDVIANNMLQVPDEFATY